MGELKHITIYTDGACSGNPGVGGWGAILIWKHHKREICGGGEYTTNNQMELTAAIKAIESVKEKSKIDLYTDSAYVKDGITKYMFNWLKNGWKTAAKKPLKNVELWQNLHQLKQQHDISWHWVKGHNGFAMNERADELARMAVKEIQQKLQNKISVN